jgi:DNA mismatch endonuclease, patch repair protein
VDDMPSDLGKRDEPDSAGVSSYETSAGRSRNMAAIKRTDTGPERRVRSELHRRGLRFRKDLRLRLDGINPRPDIVFTRRKVAVFIDGCFWHACPEHSSPPKNNQGYWGPKLQTNVERDRRYDTALRNADWLVVRVWEHEDVESVVVKVEEALEGR